MKHSAETLISLVNLSKVAESLRFLSQMKVIQPEAIQKGCKKFVKDHPEIQAAFDKMDAELGPLTK